MVWPRNEQDDLKAKIYEYVDRLVELFEDSQSKCADLEREAQELRNEIGSLQREVEDLTEAKSD